MGCAMRAEKAKSLRHLKLDKGVTRLAAADVRDLLKVSSTQANKYKNKKVECDGYSFDSIRERDRYLDLKMLARAGKIRDLELQPGYPLHVNGELVATYLADFLYVDGAGILHVEDAKGVRTAIYRMKKKLVKAIYGIDIEEV